jgi:hypothetical protein
MARRWRCTMHGLMRSAHERAARTPATSSLSCLNPRNHSARPVPQQHAPCRPGRRGRGTSAPRPVKAPGGDVLASERRRRGASVLRRRRHHQAATFGPGGDVLARHDVLARPRRSGQAATFWSEQRRFGQVSDVLAHERRHRGASHQAATFWSGQRRFGQAVTFWLRPPPPLTETDRGHSEPADSCRGARPRLPSAPESACW